MAKIRIVEVGLRDGLQNEKSHLSVTQRLELATRLLAAGVRHLEIGAFVSPKWVPQMAGTAELVSQIQSSPQVQPYAKQSHFMALVPNEHGMQDALKAGLREVAIFAACSESFSQKNINCSMAESLERFEPVIRIAKKNKVKVRGYLSVCFGCPYEGEVDEAQVVKMARALQKLGVFEISIGDTIGVANPTQVSKLIKRLTRVIDRKRLAMHFHDTRGTALANILASLNEGIYSFDTSIGGLGGCPYAPGSLGNVATEDVVFMLRGMGHQTGLKLESLVATSRWLESIVGHELPSRVAKVKPWPPAGGRGGEPTISFTRTRISASSSDKN